jgi:two-component system sensor histidine kinase KdpD
METVLEGRAVEVKLAPELPELHVDAELIQLVLRHLLDNALKYSPPSAPIRVTAASEGKTAMIRVWNGGPGIPEWERARVFEKFYRGSAADGGISGTGMGLAIARQILLAHGGEIRVESSEGGGTEFTLLLPLQKEVAA